MTPATWFDAAAIMMRSDIPVATLQFFHFMPDAAVEVLRMQTSASCLIAMIDMLAKAVDHYPVKPTEPKSDATS